MLKIEHRTLKTKSLILRRPLIIDAEDIFVCTSNPRVCRYELWYRHENIMDSFSFINNLMSQYDMGTCTDWIIVEKESQKAIGIINFHDFQGNTAYVGYWIGEEYWNKGYASEALYEIVKNAFEKWGFTDLFALCHPSNPSSQKVLTKCGFNFIGKQKTNKFQNCENDVATDFLLYFNYKVSEYNSKSSQ